MGLSSHQICMNSSDYSQSVNHEGDGSDSSASPSGDMMISSRPLEKRPRPENGQVMKCPRCDSTHTKFCYYNNYSLTQPRYFCKTCRRYWTKGGSLRNIPVGGGCRKNKRSIPTKKSNDKAMFQYEQNATNLHGAFSEVKLSDLTKLFGNTGSRDFVGTSEFGLLDSSADVTHNFQEFCSPFEMSVNNESGASMVETNQIMPLFESEDRNGRETMPNTFLSLDWHDHGRAEVSKESGGFLEEFAAWNCLMNGYGASTADLLA